MGGLYVPMHRMEEYLKPSVSQTIYWIPYFWQKKVVIGQFSLEHNRRVKEITCVGYCPSSKITYSMSANCQQLTFSDWFILMFFFFNLKWMKDLSQTEPSGCALKENSTLCTLICSQKTVYSVSRFPMWRLSTAEEEFSPLKIEKKRQNVPYCGTTAVPELQFKPNEVKCIWDRN